MPVAYNGTMAVISETSFESDAALVDKVVASIARPPEVLDVTCEEGEDWTGNSVIWIWVIVRSEAKPSEEVIRRLGQYADALHWKLIDEGIKRWPFVRLHEYVHRARRNGTRR